MNLTFEIQNNFKMSRFETPRFSNENEGYSYLWAPNVYVYENTFKIQPVLWPKVINRTPFIASAVSKIKGIQHTLKKIGFKVI